MSFRKNPYQQMDLNDTYMNQSTQRIDGQGTETGAAVDDDVVVASCDVFYELF